VIRLLVILLQQNPAFLEVSCQNQETLKIHLVKCHLNTHINTILYPESNNIAQDDGCNKNNVTYY